VTTVDKLKKIKTKYNIKKIINLFRKTIDEIYSGERIYNRIITRKLVNAYKVFFAASRKFLEDDCFTKASAIAYTTLLSLIPTLTVILTFYSFFSGVSNQKAELFSQITTFMIEHNIRLNIDPVLEAISSLIENQGKIGGIGAVILIFSATAVLRIIDKALNDIWNIKAGRTIFLKIIYFWTALSLGPVLIISGSALANQLTSTLSSPNYNSAMYSEDGKLWAVGSKASIIYTDSTGKAFNQLLISKIDFNNQEVYSYDKNGKTFLKQEFRIEELDFNKSEFKDIQFINNTGWIVGKNGMLLFTVDGGKSWKLRKFDTFGFNNIHMLNENRGFIAADNGYLISTGDGWQHLEVKIWQDITVNLKSISFNKNNGIITGERGLLIKTDDAGKSWEYKYISEASIKKKHVNINYSYYKNEKNILLACDDGIILSSNDAGQTWERKKFFDNNYYAITFIDRWNGFAAGSKGMLLATADGGQTWHEKSSTVSKISTLLIKDGIIRAFGDNGLNLVSVDNGKRWQGERWKNRILYISNFFAPFLYIWLLFLLVYMFFPNTKVPFKPAAIGAAFTSAIWVIFILLFEIYVKAFTTGSVAVYGALAAIPLFLLMVYTSFLIVLYGAEVSYTLMHPHTYLILRKSVKNKKDIYLYFGISILHFIYKKFESGKGTTNYKELLKVCSNSDEEISYFVEIFKKEKYITESDTGLSPANSSRNIYLSDIINLIHDISLIVPGIISSRDKLKKQMEDIFKQIKKSKDGIVGKITLADLIERA
jgi:membrane protein